MWRNHGWLPILCVVVLLAGCFDLEHGVQLNEDYSGTATFNFFVDMEPMVLIMATMTKAFSGDESPPTAEEIAAARADFLAQKDSQDDWSFERTEAEEKLPEGVRLISFEPFEEELGFGAKLKLEFDHYSKLREIDFASRTEGEAQPATMGPGKPQALDRPYANLVFTDEGETMLITSPASNPLDDLQKDNPMADEDMGEVGDLLAESFEKLRIATSLTLPFDLVEHNATRVDGDTLWWEYDLAAFERLDAEQLAEGIRVRFKK